MLNIAGIGKMLLFFSERLGTAFQSLSFFEDGSHVVSAAIFGCFVLVIFAVGLTSQSRVGQRSWRSCVRPRKCPIFTNFRQYADDCGSVDT